MADFNVDVGGPQLSARPLQPVQDNSTAQGINSLGNLFTGIGSTVKSAIGAGEAQKVNAENQRILGMVKQNILVKADLVDQGWSSDRALRATRRQLAADLANHPNLSKEITAIYAETLTKTGLGSNILDGTQAEQDAHAAKKAVFDDMLKSGMVDPSLKMDSPEGERAMDTYQQYRLQQTNLEASQKELTYKRGQIGYQSDIVQLASAKQSYVTGGITQQIARLNLSEKQAEVQGRAAITAGAQAANELLSKKMGDIYNQWITGQRSASDATIAIDQELARLQGAMTAVGPSAGGDYIKNVMSPMVSLASTLKEGISGKVDATALQNQLNATQNQMSLMMIHNNPKVLPIISTSNLLKNLPPAVLRNITDVGLSMIGYNSETDSFDNVNPTDAFVGPGASKSNKLKAPKLPDLTGDTEDTQAVISYLKGSMDSVLGGVTNEDGSVNEVNNVIRTAVKSFGKHGQISEDPSDLTPLVQLFASPSFGKYVKQYKPQVDVGDSEKARETLTKFYYDKAIPLIRQEYVKAVTLTGGVESGSSDYASAKGLVVPKTEATTASIIPTFDGSRVRFIVTDPSIAGASAKADELNRNVAKVLTMTVMAQANLGQVDPREVYNEVIGQVLDNPDKALAKSHKDADTK